MFSLLLARFRLGSPDLCVKLAPLWSYFFARLTVYVPRGRDVSGWVEQSRSCCFGGDASSEGQGGVKQRAVSRSARRDE
jgi:hypothetical protein